jgi:hypothetical protein
MTVAAVTAYVAMTRLTRNIGLAIAGLGALAALVLPTGAVAKRTTVAPPGNSGISQYLEVVPTAAGPSPPGAGGGQGGVLTGLQRHRLDASGPNGRTLVTVVDATAPQQPAPANRSPAATGQSGAPGEGASRAPNGTGATQALPPALTGSRASLIFDAVDGSGGGGLGGFLPAFMLVSALALAGAYAARRRRLHQ